VKLVGTSAADAGRGLSRCLRLVFGRLLRLRADSSPQAVARPAARRRLKTVAIRKASARLMAKFTDRARA
jgi:hypothetical protein